MIINSVSSVARSCGGKGHESNALTNPSPQSSSYMVWSGIMGGALRTTPHSRGEADFNRANGVISRDGWMGGFE